MSRETPIERLGRGLGAAGGRPGAAGEAAPPRGRRRGGGPPPPRGVPGGGGRRGRRRWRGHTLAVAILAVGASAGAASWAATSLLSSGSPVPFQRGVPIAGRAQGAPIPGTVKLLTDGVSDPGGGPAWGLRYWE